MKAITAAATLVIFTGLLPTRANAQLPGGFFSQQGTKEKLMAQQIAELKVYLQALNSGYAIRNKGLTSANALKKTSYTLHAQYFQSLEQINRTVKNNPEGRAIADLQQQIIHDFSSEIEWQQKQQLLSANELSYLKQVFDNIRRQCQLDLDETTDVLTPGKLQLTDQQRVQRLDHLYESIKDKRAFASHFTNKCRKLALSRWKSRQEKDQLKKLYGIQ